MMTIRRGLILLAVAVFLVTSSCDPAPPNPGMGIRRTDDGIELLAIGCNAESIRRISLIVDHDGLLANAEDDVRWEVVADSAGSIVRVTIGSSPPPFRTTVPLSGVVPIGADVFVIAETDADLQYIALASSPPRGNFTTEDGGVRTEAEIQQDVESSCR